MAAIYPMPASQPMFEDRQAAGRALAKGLGQRGLKFGAVLGLARGGVPVGFEVASAYGVPLDVIVVKKLRSPISEELAIGAVCGDGSQVVRRDIIRELGVSDSYLEGELEVRALEARDEEALYHGNNLAADLSGLSVVIVDDGIATGATMEAGVVSARRRGASAVTVAAPIASRQSCDELRQVVDEVFCLATPVDFEAVGQFYASFPQMPDEEVRRWLDENRATTARGARPPSP